MEKHSYSSQKMQQTHVQTYVKEEEFHKSILYEVHVDNFYIVFILKYSKLIPCLLMGHYQKWIDFDLYVFHVCTVANILLY